MGGLPSNIKTENSLMFIGKKLSFNAVLSGNNLGEQVFSFSDYLTNIVGLDNLLYSGGTLFNLSSDEVSMLIPNSSVYRSLAGFSSLSGTYQASDKLKIKGSVMASGNRDDAFSESEQDYFLMGLTNFHRTANRTGNTFFSTQLQETWKPSEKVEFSNRTRYVRTSMNDDDTLTERGMSSINSFNTSDMVKHAISDEMVLNMKQGDNLVSIHLTGSHQRRNYTYDLFTDRMLLPTSYYAIEGDGYAIRHDKEVRQTSLAPDVTYALSLGKQYKLNTTLAFEHIGDEFSYTPESGDSIDAWLTTNEARLSVALNKNKGLFQFSLGMEGVVDGYGSSIGDIDGSTRGGLYPSARLELDFSSTNRLSLSANMGQSAIELAELLRQPLVTSYNSLFDSSYIVDPRSKSEHVNMNYFLQDEFSNTTFFAGASVSHNHFSVKSYTVQDTTIFTRSRTDNNGESLSEYVYASLSKGLGSLPADLRLNGNYSRSQSQTTVNMVDGNVVSNSISGSLRVVTRSKKVVNGELGVNYSTSKSAYSQLAGVTSSMYSYGASGALTVAVKQFKGEARFSYSNTVGSNYEKDYFNLSFKAEYKVKNWRFILRGSNLLYLDDIDALAVNNTSTYISTTRYRKIPGYIIAGIGYRF